MKKTTYSDVEAYILDGVDGSGYDKELPGAKDKMQFVYDTFMAEYGWHVKQVGELKALESWLSGLPSSVNVEWRNNEILKLGVAWNLLAKDARENEENRFLERWFPFMAMRIKGMWERLGVVK